MYANSTKKVEKSINVKMEVFYRGSITPAGVCVKEQRIMGVAVKMTVEI